MDFEWSFWLLLRFLVWCSHTTTLLATVSIYRCIFMKEDELFVSLSSFSSLFSHFMPRKLLLIQFPLHRMRNLYACSVSFTKTFFILDFCLDVSLGVCSFWFSLMPYSFITSKKKFYYSYSFCWFFDNRRDVQPIIVCALLFLST